MKPAEPVINFHIILKKLNILRYSNETLSAEKLIL